jgi:hygromycin-B 7''-O-kinase
MPGRVRSLFGGFGHSSAEFDFTLKRRLMVLLLLHRFSDPNRHISIEGWQDQASDLFQLQELLWPD